MLQLTLWTEENTMAQAHDKFIIPTNTQKIIIKALLPILKTTDDIELVKAIDILSSKFIEYQDNDNDISVEFNTYLGELEDKIKGDIRNPGWLEEYEKLIEETLASIN